MRANVMGLEGVLSNRPARVFCLNASTCFDSEAWTAGSIVKLSEPELLQDKEDIFSSSRMLSTM